MMRNIEVPEKNVQVKKQNSPYTEEWLNKQVDLVLGLIVDRLPILGLTICKGHLDSPAWNQMLKNKIVEYYTEMHQWVFSELKNTIRSQMSPDEYDFSFETMKTLIVDLEKEYAKDLEELGIEPDSVISAFAKNQSLWYQKNFSWRTA